MSNKLSSVDGFVACKSDIFSVKKEPVFLIKLSKNKDCLCSAVNVLIKLNDPQMIETAYTLLALRQPARLVGISIRTIYKRPSESIVSETNATMSSQVSQQLNDRKVFLLSSLESIIVQTTQEPNLLNFGPAKEVGQCSSCQNESRQLVQYRGTVTDMSRSHYGMIRLDSSVDLIFLGKCSKKLDLIESNQLLYCYNVWLIKDFPKGGDNAEIKFVLVADVVSSIVVTCGNTSSISSLQIKSVNCSSILHQLVHHYSLNPFEIIDLCHLIGKVRRCCCSNDDSAFQLLQHLYAILYRDRTVRQFARDFVELGDVVCRRDAHDSAIDDTLYSAQDISCAADYLQNTTDIWLKQTLSAATDVSKYVAEWFIPKQPVYLFGHLSLDLDKLCPVLSDNTTRLPCCLEGDWSALVNNGLNVFTNFSIIKESFPSSPLPVVYLKARAADISSVQPKTPPTHCSPCRYCFTAFVLNKSGLLADIYSWLVGFSCRVRVHDVCFTIKFCADAATTVSRVEPGCAYVFCDGREHTFSTSDLLFGVDSQQVVYCEKSPGSCGEGELTDKKISVNEWMKHPDLLWNNSYKLWGLIKSKHRFDNGNIEVVLQDINTKETISVYNSDKRYLFGLVPGQLISISGLRHSHKSRTTRIKAVSFLASSDVQFLEPLAPLNTRELSSVPEQKYFSDVIALYSSGGCHQLISSRCNLIRIFSVTLYSKDSKKLQGTVSALVDDGTAAATVFTKDPENIRTLLHFSSHLWTLLNTCLSRSKQEYKYLPHQSGAKDDTDCRTDAGENSTMPSEYQISMQCPSLAVTSHDALSEWLNAWLQSSMTLRPLSMTLRLEQQLSADAVGNQTCMFQMKRTTLCGQEIDMLMPRLLRFYCLSIKDK